MASERAEPRLSGANSILRGASRLFRFAGGLVAGVLVVPFLGALGLAGMYATATVSNWFAPEPPARPWVEVRGQDVSAAGGVRLTLKNKSWALRLDCRDACDDLVETGPAQQLEVLSAGGKCVACREQDGSSLWSKPPKTWLLKGRPLLVEEGEAS